MRGEVVDDGVELLFRSGGSFGDHGIDGGLPAGARLLLAYGEVKRVTLAADTREGFFARPVRESLGGHELRQDQSSEQARLDHCSRATFFVAALSISLRIRSAVL